jgi:hypothetical protein
MKTRTDSFAGRIQSKFATLPPLFLANSPKTIKAELKPYVQPFERVLAEKELRALLDPDDTVTEEHGLFVIETEKDERELQDRLTYWQRVGRKLLVPTLQGAVELTQSGLADLEQKAELHRARRLRYGPHDLHEYRGKFFPQLVRSLINISGVHDDGLVIDPMCGSGTTLCEAVAFGRGAIGVDLNPLSVLISRVKAGIALEAPSIFRDKSQEYFESMVFRPGDPGDAWSPKDEQYLARWFDPRALVELAGVLRELRAIRSTLYRDFFKVCLSNIVRGVSWQKSADLRVRKEVKPFESGAVFEAFRAEVEEQVDRIFPYLCVLQRTRTKPALDVIHGSSVGIDSLLPNYVGRCDVLITSPPYATALPYLDTDRLSLIVLGLLDRGNHRMVETSMIGTREVTERERKESWEVYLSRRKELPKSVTQLIDRIAVTNHGGTVGFRRRNLPALLGKYFLDMLDAMHSARRMMRSGSYAFYVVGNNSTMVENERVEIATDKLLVDLGARAGWTPEAHIPMELIPSRDIFKENRGTAEAILQFRT